MQNKLFCDGGYEILSLLSFTVSPKLHWDYFLCLPVFCFLNNHQETRVHKGKLTFLSSYSKIGFPAHS